VIAARSQGPSDLWRVTGAVFAQASSFFRGLADANRDLVAVSRAFGIDRSSRRLGADLFQDRCGVHASRE
jgi:hypothetical protein